MFFIPGFLIALITFPGVIVHEIAHRFFCDIAGVPVYDVCYIRVGNPAGYVIHGQVDSLWKSFLISVGPFIINTLLCALIAFPVQLPMFVLKDTSHGDILLLWLSVSIGMHAFPSKQDLDNFHQQVKASKGFSPLLVFSWILGAMFTIARLLSFFWFDAIYAIAIAAVIPGMVAGWL